MKDRDYMLVLLALVMALSGAIYSTKINNLNHRLEKVESVTPVELKDNQWMCTVDYKQTRMTCVKN